MLALLEEALRHPIDYVHLLSGRDWPLCSREMICGDIAAAGAADCFVAIDHHDRGWRMDDFCFVDRRLRPRVSPNALSWRVNKTLTRASHTADRVLKAVGWRRPRPLGPWVSGSQWWSLPRDGAEHARDALQRTISSGRLRFTQCSDEHVVQTALFNSPLRSRIGGNRRLVVCRPGEWSPMVLTASHVAASNHGAWFGRKFDAEVDDFFLRL
jgi:hypothetical protein